MGSNSQLLKIKKDRNPKLLDTPKMIDDFSIESSFYFVGTSKPEEPRPGCIYLDPTTNETFVYNGKLWDPIGSIPNEPYRRPSNIIDNIEEPIVCTHCGASGLKGHKCSYCGSYL